MPFFKAGGFSPNRSPTRATNTSLTVTYLLNFGTHHIFSPSLPHNAPCPCDKPRNLGISSSRTQNCLPGPKEEPPRDHDIHGRESPFRGHVGVPCLLSNVKLMPLAGKANTKQSSKSGSTPKTSSPANGNMSTIRSRSARPTARNQRSTTMVHLSHRKSSRKNWVATAICHRGTLKVWRDLAGTISPVC